MTIYYFLLLEDNTGYVLQEDTGKIIIDQADSDERNEGVVTAAIIQIQTVDPVTITPIGSFELNSVISIPTPTFVERILSIATNTTVSVATGATVCVITPLSTNTHAITLKGASGDTGVLLNMTQPTTLTLDPAQTTFILNCASTITITATFI